MLSHVNQWLQRRRLQNHEGRTGRACWSREARRRTTWPAAPAHAASGMAWSTSLTDKIG